MATGGEPTPIDLTRLAGQGRRLTPALFVLVALCFLLPFVSVSCGGENIVTASGLDFLVGADVTVADEFEEAIRELEDLGGDTSPREPAGELADDRIDPNVFAIVAFAAAVLGAVLGFARRAQPPARALLGAAALVVASLVAFRIDIGGTPDDAAGVASVDYRIGYWGAMLLAVAILLAHGVEEWRRRAVRPR